MADTVPLVPMLAQASNDEKPAKSKAASELGKARAAKLTPERRKEIARLGGLALAKKRRAEKAEEARRAKEKRKKH